MGLDFQEKLNLLGAGAAEEVACQSCAANPKAAVVTHRATRPIRANDIQPVQRTTFTPSRQGLGTAKPPRDLKPWLSSAIRSDGKRVAIVNTIRVQSKSFDRNRLFKSLAISQKEHSYNLLGRMSGSRCYGF